MLTHKFSDALCVPLKKGVQAIQKGRVRDLFRIESYKIGGCSTEGGRQRRQINSCLGPHEMAQLWKLQVAEFMQGQVSKGMMSWRTR